jgi:hypothetical protein
METALEYGGGAAVALEDGGGAAVLGGGVGWRLKIAARPWVAAVAEKHAMMVLAPVSSKLRAYYTT